MSTPGQPLVRAKLTELLRKSVDIALLQAKQVQAASRSSVQFVATRLMFKRLQSSRRSDPGATGHRDDFARDVRRPGTEVDDDFCIVLSLSDACQGHRCPGRRFHVAK